MTDDHTRRPRGRRDNGLQARTYLPLDDVDPRVGEHLLDVLYLAGIAAYLRPSMDTDVVTRAASLPSRPSDRVFVDRTRLVDARRLVSAEAAEAGRPTSHPMAGDPHPSSSPDSAAAGTAEPARGDAADHRPTAGDPPSGDTPYDGPYYSEPHHNRPPYGDPTHGDSTRGDPTGPDFDAAFASIIAGYDTPTGDPVGRWSVAEDVEDVGPTDSSDGDRTSAAATDDDSLDGAADVDEGTGPRDWQPGAGSADDERFVPPPPPPLPHVSRGTSAAMAIMAIGVLLFLFPGMLGLSGDLALAVPIGAIVVGVVILVWRMYDGPPVDDGPDDGAVV